MIRKIYTTFVSFAFVVLTLSSCSDWLDLYPSDEIKEEYLFSSGDGFRTATNGIYRKMATFNLYGSNLTWGIMDAWAQSYYIDQAPSIGGGTAMRNMAALQFKNTELVPVTDAMWNAAWNVVANCNELAQQAAKADPNLFSGLDGERQMILGEAIGLRAFIQFDLLRIMLHLLHLLVSGKMIVLSFLMLMFILAMSTTIKLLVIVWNRLLLI